MKIEDAAKRLGVTVDVIALFAKYRRFVWYRDEESFHIYIDESDVSYFEKYIAENGSLPSIQWQNDIDLNLIFS